MGAILCQRGRDEEKLGVGGFLPTTRPRAPPTVSKTHFPRFWWVSSRFLVRAVAPFRPRPRGGRLGLRCHLVCAALWPSPVRRGAHHHSVPQNQGQRSPQGFCHWLWGLSLCCQDPVAGSTTVCQMASPRNARPRPQLDLATPPPHDHCPCLQC